MPALPVDHLRRHYAATDAEIEELSKRFEALDETTPESLPEGQVFVSQENAMNISSSWLDEQLEELRPKGRKKK